jgi:sulfur carrier protein ThiS
MTPDAYGHGYPAQDFEVDLPAGGKLHLQSLEEVELWEESAKRYIDAYAFAEQNDLLTLGAILSQQLVIFRAQQQMNGMIAEVDDELVPTGRWKRGDVDADDMRAAATQITKASGEVRELEKQLGIDKKTREAGGQHTVQDYVKTLKAATREFGLHISKRTKAYEKVVMEARWRLRLLENGDAEDQAYHDLSEEKFCAWLRGQLAELEEVDKEFAKAKHAVVVGRL